MMSVFSKIDKYHLFIPVGKYAQYIEYLLIGFISYLIVQAYRHKDTEVDNCHTLMYYIAKIPVLKFLVDSIMILLLSYLGYYLILLYFHSHTTPVRERSFEVQVIDITGRGRRTCKPLMQTDFYKRYNPKNPTFMYRFFQKYSLNDDICLKGLYFYPGQTVVLKIEESPFGMSVSNVKVKVY